MNVSIVVPAYNEGRGIRRVLSALLDQETRLARIVEIVVVAEFFFPERFSDTRFRVAAPLTRLVSVPRLHERLLGLFALESLYVCARVAR
jgi:hypothetical protein